MLKPEIRLEVLKTQVLCFEDAAKIVLRVDCSLWSTNNLKSTFGSTGNAINDPMEIGNVQPQTNEGQKCQRANDLRNNQCVICHTKICRPWKCTKKGKVNNLGVHPDDEIVDTVTFDDAFDDDLGN